MSTYQGAKLLQLHFSERNRYQGKPLHEAIVSECMELGMAGVTVYRGIEGYGASTRIHRTGHWKFSRDAPIQLTVIDKDDQIEKLLPHLDAMVQEGLVAISRVEVIRYSREEDVPGPHPGA